MLITSSSAHQKENGPDCTVRGYPFPSQDLGFAKAHIRGRYPKQGKSINHSCDMIYYITGGEGIIHTAEGEFAVKTGDAFFFAKDTRYRIETQNLKIILPSSPSRYYEQYEEIE